VFHEFVRPPAGGGNQFLLALIGELERRGFRIERNVISGGTRACLFNSYNFGFDRLARFARAGCRMVHRVDGPIGVYRGSDDGTDAAIWEINGRLAAATVFQSRYSLEKHRELGMEFVSPTVIHNAVDPEIFFPASAASDLGPQLRLISVSWSENANKGGEVYAWLDERLNRGRYAYTFVGRTLFPLPKGETIPPVSTLELARLLRQHDVLVTASRHESCPNHVIEALACGLPVVYLESGATSEVVGVAGLPFCDRDELPNLLERVRREYAALRAAVSVPTIEEVADRYLRVLALDG
jgi:glycosyltransferase involved in cell wall biosynthesis